MLSLPVELLILALLVLANGVLAMAETAVVAAKKTRLRQLAKEDPRAQSALRLAEQPTRFLALVEFWLTLSGMIAGVLAGASLAGTVEDWLRQWPALGPYADWLALVIVTVGLTSFMLIFGELVPKRVGLAQPEKVASLLASTMRFLAWLAAPLLKIIELVTEGLVKLIGIKPRAASEAINDDEVRALIEQGMHAGVFHRAEGVMVEGVLTLDRRPVTAIMTPRPKIVFLNVDDPEETNWRKIVTSGHSYFPVYQRDRDQIVGMVAVKALWAHSAIGLPTTLKNLLVPPLMVSEKATVIVLLEQFKRTGRHIAVVTDEFGAVQGLVTLIDVMEAIVGDLPDRGTAQAQPQTKKREDGSLLVDATLAVGELKTLLGIDGAPLPHEGQAEFQTLGGFVVTHLGKIPAVGDRFEWGGWKFEVIEMDRRRVDKVALTKLVTATTEEVAEEKERKAS